MSFFNLLNFTIIQDIGKPTLGLTQMVHCSWNGVYNNDGKR